jgi:Fe-S-cluster-containing hydrogenase component 2
MQKLEEQLAEKRFIATDLEKCTGCGTCELVCSIKKENVYSSHYSRIKILRLYRLVNMAVVCRQCEDAPCVNACPHDCLVQSASKGAIIVDEDKCDCCGWCVGACPFGAVTINPEKNTVMMCDLCEGNPQCIEWCPEGALDLVSQKIFNEHIKKAVANKLIMEKGRKSQPFNVGHAPEKEYVEEPEKIEQSLNLLIEAFSEPNPIDILIYGMFVKNKLGSIIPKSTEKIEKTLKWLKEAIDFVEEHEFPNVSMPS